VFDGPIVKSRACSGEILTSSVAVRRVTEDA
jgi:hypothetical protein